MAFGFSFALTAIRKAIAVFSPASLFAAGEQGVWYDPSDLTTLFQDSAGTTPVTAVEQPVGKMLDKSGRGNHATQTTSTKRPVLSARYNLLLATDTLSTQSVITSATSYVLSFSGAGTVTLTGTATGVKTSGSNSFTATAGTLTLTVVGSVTSASLVPADQASLPYQWVNTATDYATTGFKPYLKFDGIDDALSTGSINFTSTDKMTVWAGVRKLSDTPGGSYPVVVELSFSSNVTQNTFSMVFANTELLAAYQSRGSGALVSSSAAFSSPKSAVITGISAISTPVATLRLNGSEMATSSVTQGSGTYGNYPLYIGARGPSTTAPVNGTLYSLIVRGAQSTTPQITNTETYVNGKTGAY